jgi:hypothetical protein
LPNTPSGVHYFDRRSELVTRDADRCRAVAAMWTAETAPAWAARFAGHDRDLTGELAVWRTVNAVPDTDTRAVGMQTRAGRPTHQASGWSHHLVSTSQCQRDPPPDIN